MKDVVISLGRADSDGGFQGFCRSGSAVKPGGELCCMAQSGAPIDEVLMGWYFAGVGQAPTALAFWVDYHAVPATTLNKMRVRMKAMIGI
jgi:hypothetical protein